MPSIKSIAQASGYIAAYAGETRKEDRLEPVLCWSVIEFEGEEPDEVVGQIFDGNCITEVTSVDEEEGYGEFIGYFKDNEDGRERAVRACKQYRDRSVEEDDEEEEDEEEDDDGEEGEEEDEEGEEGDEEDEEEEDEPPKKKKKKVDAAEEKDDFESWKD